MKPHDDMSPDPTETEPVPTDRPPEPVRHPRTGDSTPDPTTEALLGAVDRGGLGRHGARLIVGLAASGRTLFTLDEIHRRSGLHPRHCESLLRGLVERGWLRRVRKGLYALIPIDIVDARQWSPDPVLVAAHLFSHATLSHGTALLIHGLTLQGRPMFPYTVVSPMRQADVMIDQNQYHAVYRPAEAAFGAMDLFHSGTLVRVTDLERTFCDVLLEPDHCGGIWEAMRAFGQLHDRLDFERLDEYVQRIDRRVLCKRLGYTCELFGVFGPWLDRWHARVDANYNLLDPTGQVRGLTHPRWRLRININPRYLETLARR